MDLQKLFEKQGSWLFINRGWLPFIILIPGLWIYCSAQSRAPFATSSDMWHQLGCLAVGLIGLAVRAYTVGYSHANTSGRNTTEGQIADSLNTTGIYSIVRHPLYLGNFLMWLSVALLIKNLGFTVAFCLAFWLYYERIMLAEEIFLKQKFGEAFERWATSTPAFIPRFKQFVKPDSTFNWHKVLMAEKNGLFELFLAFFTFDFLGTRFRGDHRYNYVLMAGCIITIMLYFAIKYKRYRDNKKLS